MLAKIGSKPTLLLFFMPIILLSVITLQPTIKIYTYKYCTQVWFRVYNAVMLKVWDEPIPISYVIKADVNKKLANPAQWALQQINTDFAHSRDVSLANVQRTYAAFEPDQLVFMFTIKDGELKVTKPDHAMPNYIMNGACQRGLEIYSNIFAYIAKHGYVNNVSFLLRLSDFFTAMPEDIEDNFAPILTTSKDISHPIENRLVLIPDYMSLEDIPKFTPRIMQANKVYPWHKKQHKILWRGGEADISGFRHSLVAYNTANPSEFIDAAFVLDPAQYMPPEIQVRAKFLLNIDGHTAAWTRPIWQLLSNSVFVKQDSALTQWYYQALAPHVHYIPVGNDPSVLAATINKYSDEKLQAIAAAGSKFAQENLLIDDMLAYMIMTLQKYEQLQSQHIAQKHGDMLVSQKHKNFKPKNLINLSKRTNDLTNKDLI